MRMRHIVICGMTRSTIFFPTFSYKRQEFQKKSYWTKKRVFWFSPQILSETFHILRRSELDMIKKWTAVFMYSTLHVQYPLSYSIFMNFEFIPQIFENSSKMKFHKNTSNGTRVVPCGQTDEQTRRSCYSFSVILRTRLNSVKYSELSVWPPIFKYTSSEIQVRGVVTTITSTVCLSSPAYWLVKFTKLWQMLKQNNGL